MNMKDLFFVMIMALLTTWAFEYFFLGKKPFQAPTDQQASQRFTAPEQKRELKPLNREIDFIDTKRSRPAQSLEVDTDYAIFSFTNDGATLERATFKQSREEKDLEITTIFPVGPTDKEKQCFLLALNEKTPYFYTLDQQKEEDDRIIVAYKAITPEVAVTKTFTIFKQIHKIDVSVSLSPKQGPIEARLVFPSPIMPELGDHERLSAVMSNEKGKIVVERTLSNLDDAGWFEPTLFGTANKYFVHSMVSDENKFAQRSYYGQFSSDMIVTFLEGPTITQDTTWNVSFFLGPKTEEAMNPVDPRLTNTLDYAGWLTPISRLLLSFMKWLHEYLHNYGWVIIVLTILLRLVMMPFTLRGEKGTKEREEFQRRMAYIQKKYKHDPEMMKKEQAALIQKYGFPGLGGCLPTLIQLPVFFALNPILASSLHLYKVPFLWIPDLSARDPYFVVPVLIMLFMFVQGSKMDAQQRMMFYIFGLFIGALSANFSAGLSLYIFTSTLLGVVQTMIQKKVA